MKTGDESDCGDKQIIQYPAQTVKNQWPVKGIRNKSIREETGENTIRIPPRKFPYGNFDIS